LDGLRKENGDVFLQAVDADSVYGAEHVLGIIAIVMEATKKGLMIAKKAETEFLLRLACTNQISEAIARVGLKQGSPACFIVFAKDAAKLKSFARFISNVLEIDEAVIGPTAKKRALLAKRIGVDAKPAHDDLKDHLVENAAILTK